ncbi:hypothetical protein GPECTOR_22g789 [Gonium pectorale]|uniref:Uncharacterized protein n=1 Tax=Gonium pectorale TaxID=33097 RepID=A0A150GHD4_GONPE|nr:hypothetical protein GPECTOR_22g789 [Gonium pectorale]|eukprot:KXZ49199.1 hypothetical protein GPECTOR_22g789 [Gonium pectorale]
MRYELFQAARDSGAAFLQLHLPCSPQLALARNATRSGLSAVPREAILRMAQALEPPQRERFAWEACTLTVQASTIRGRELGSDGKGIDGVEDDGHGCAPDRSTTTELLQERDAAPRTGAEAEKGAVAKAESKAEERPSPDAVATICRELWRLWGPAPPPPPSEEELEAQRAAGRAANAASLLHGLDLRTRKALAEAVARAGAATRSERARALNERRRALLQAAREALAEAAKVQGRPRGGSGSSGGDGGGEGLEGVVEWLAAQEAAFMLAVQEEE